MEQIEDGKGSGTRAHVGADYRLQVRAIDEPELVHNTERGGSFNINTGLISITGDATLIYFKNNSEESYILTDIAVGTFEGITHSNIPYLTVIKNPTGGDLITDATPVPIKANRNFGSSKEAQALIYKGKVGGTITGGEEYSILQTNKTGRSFFTLVTILPKGASIAVKLNANLSSGSANYYLALIGYFKDNLDAE